MMDVGFALLLAGMGLILVGQILSLVAHIMRMREANQREEKE